MAATALTCCQSQQHNFSAAEASDQPLSSHFEFPSLSVFTQGAAIASISRPALPDALCKAAEWVVELLPSVGASKRGSVVSSTPFSQASSSTPANRLRSALTAYHAFGQDWKSSVLSAVLASGGLVGAATQLLSPTGPGGCDHNLFERCANCATSAPYVMIGVHALKHRKTRAGKAWGASMCAVGAASTCFHASSGNLRPTCRRMDYWSIALASNLMTRAVFPDLPIGLTVAGVLLTPFKPFAVSFLNSTAMELKYLYLAQQRAELRPVQRLHAATCLAGLGVFALEDVFPRLPLVHAAWHCLSAAAVGSVNYLLDDVERQQAHHGVLRHSGGSYSPPPLLHGGATTTHHQPQQLVDTCKPLTA